MKYVVTIDSEIAEVFDTMKGAVADMKWRGYRLQGPYPDTSGGQERVPMCARDQVSAGRVGIRPQTPTGYAGLRSASVTARGGGPGFCEECLGRDLRHRRNRRTIHHTAMTASTQH